MVSGPRNADDPRRSWAWQKLRKQRVQLGRLNGEVCVRCGRPIDYTLKGNQRWGPSVDHLHPLQLGGVALPPLEALAMAHFRCNSAHGARVQGMRARRAGISTTKRDLVVEIPASVRSSPNVLVLPPARPAARPPVEPADFGRLAGNADLSRMPSDASPPRLFSASHPRAVGSFAPRFIAWANERMAPWTLRWWQELVLDRALEHDEQGHLVWRTVVVSTPRQVGKSVLVRETSLARAVLGSDLFAEPQEIILASRTLTNATYIHAGCWSWAKDEGLSLLRRFGSERVGWPDGSRWAVSSLDAIYGYSSSMVMCDESWDLQPRTLTSGVLPVLSARRSPQLWLLSTAHAAATDVMPQARVQATREGSSTMLAEWSAPPGADLDDIETYRLASPHWDDVRAELIGSVLGTADVGTQFGNRWMVDETASVAPGWPAGWSECARVSGGPPGGCVVAVEADLERATFGVAAAAADGLNVRVWARVLDDDLAALQLIRQWQPSLVLIGASLHDRLAPMMQCETRKAGLTETKLGTPTLQAAVRDRRIAHDHDPKVAEQVAGAVVASAESGPLLTARRSGPISGIKAAAWAVSNVLDSAPVEQAAIF
jgi:hypothetical protein